jgi:hypothetical protein
MLASRVTRLPLKAPTPELGPMPLRPPRSGGHQSLNQAFCSGNKCFSASQTMRSSRPSHTFSRPPMAPTQRRSPGLLRRGRIWHIDKILYGKRICESTRSGDRIEAEALLARRVTQARRVHLFGEPCEHSFRQAAAMFLAENQHKRSIERDRRSLAMLDPFIGSLLLQGVHHDTLAPFVRSRGPTGHIGKLPMSPEKNGYRCARNGPKGSGGQGGN